MNDFRIRQQVVCVDDEGLGLNSHVFSYPRRGQIYTIRELLAHVDGTPCLRLVEIVNPKGVSDEGPDIPHEPYFACGRFRPLVAGKTDIGFAHEILRKTNVPDEVAA